MGCSILEAKRGALNFLVLQSVFRGMLLKRGTNAGNERGERENERWEQNRELENEIADRARVQGWFYFPIFHFPVSHACSPLSVPSFSNTRFPRAY